MIEVKTQHARIDAGHDVAGSAPSGVSASAGGVPHAANQRAQDARSAREHEGFDEQLPQHVPLPRAERRPHGQLSAPRRRPGQLQAGDVGARDEQKQQHRREERRDEPRPVEPSSAS